MVARALALAVMLLAPTGIASAHPLHTTITEVTENRANGTIRATIRVFADDFGTAVTRSLRGRAVKAGAAWDSAAVAYVASSFSLATRDGRPLALRSCGIRRTTELFWICVEAVSPQGLAPLTIRNRVLCDVWDDQVNVVQVVIGGARKSLLFTKGDGAKRLT